MCKHCIEVLEQIEIQSGRYVRDHYDFIFRYTVCFFIQKHPSLPPLCHRSDQIYLSHQNTMFHQPRPDFPDLHC